MQYVILGVIGSQPILLFSYEDVLCYYMLHVLPCIASFTFDILLN